MTTIVYEDCGVDAFPRLVRLTDPPEIALEYCDNIGAKIKYYTYVSLQSNKTWTNSYSPMAHTLLKSGAKVTLIQE